MSRFSPKHKLCPPNKILNPKTGRCVLKSGKLGQALLKNKTRPSPSPVQSPCPPNKIINPKTGRCVLKNGKLGQELLQGPNPSPSPSPVPSPMNVVQIDPTRYDPNFEPYYQSGGLGCGRFAMNNLFQNNVYNKSQLKKLCTNLKKRNPVIFARCDRRENYDIQFLIHVLQNYSPFNLYVTERGANQCINVVNDTIVVDERHADYNKVYGIIINTPGHWTCARLIQGDSEPFKYIDSMDGILQEFTIDDLNYELDYESLNILIIYTQRPVRI